MYIKIVCKDCGKCLRECNVDSDFGDGEIIVPLCSDCKKEVYEDGYSTGYDDGYDDGEADNCQDDN